MNIRIELLNLQLKAPHLNAAEFAAKFTLIAEEYSRLQKCEQAHVSRRIVHGCYDCPMCDMLDMSPGYACQLVDSQKVGYIKENKKTHMPETPHWCPIKAKPLLIQYGR